MHLPIQLAQPCGQQTWKRRTTPVQNSGIWQRGQINVLWTIFQHLLRLLWLQARDLRSQTRFWFRDAWMPGRPLPETPREPNNIAPSLAQISNIGNLLGSMRTRHLQLPLLVSTLPSTCLSCYRRVYDLNPTFGVTILMT